MYSLIISKITRQKQLTDRYNIFVLHNGKEDYAFSVDEAILIKYQLRKGLELDSLTLNEIQYNDDIRKGYHLAVNYLSKVKRSEEEVRKYLKGKIEDDFIVSEAIAKLHKMNFLDDEDYAFSYVRTQINTSNKGPEVIKRELREKGISDVLIKKAMEELTYDSQLQSAQKIARKLMDSNKKDSYLITIQKMEQTLVRKGYTSAIIQEVKSGLAKKEENDELAILRVQGEKAQRKFSSYTGFEFHQKMKQFLYRKGFSLDLIEQFLEEIKEE